MLDAVGLAWPDLFPDTLERKAPRPKGRRKRGVPPIPAEDALMVLDVEALAVQIVAERLLRGEPIDDESREALGAAASRIGRIRAGWRVL